MRAFLVSTALTAALATWGAPYYDQAAFDLPAFMPYFESFDDIDTSLRPMMKSFYSFSGSTLMSYGVEIPDTAAFINAGTPLPPGNPGPGPSYQASITFDANAKAFGIPFTHVGLYLNPWGHGPFTEWMVSHFDVHFYLLSPAQEEMMLCHNTTQYACEDPEDAMTFSTPPYLPDGFLCADPTAQMGLHCLNPAYLGHFNTTPAIIYGGAYGQLSFWEPMVAFTVLDAVAANSANCFPWVPPKHHPVAGFYPQTLCVGNKGTGVMTVYFTDLYWVDGTAAGTPLYTGARMDLTVDEAAASVGGSCFVHKGSVTATGTEITTAAGELMCCRNKATDSGSGCTTGCTPSPLSMFSYTSGNKCYYNCHPEF